MKKDFNKQILTYVESIIMWLLNKKPQLLASYSLLSLSFYCMHDTR